MAHHSKTDGEGIQAQLDELNLQIEYVDIARLKPHPKNPRKRPKKQLHIIAGSYKAHNIISPTVVDENYIILAGHGRYEAARLNGIKRVPVICVRHLTEEQKLSYMIADNQTATYSSFDIDPLHQIIQCLDRIDYPLQYTGFETGQLDKLLIVKNATNDDAIPEIPAGYQPVTKLGDLWKLGRHFLICGDATDIETYKHLMGAEKAQMCITDPPWAVPVHGHIKKKDNKKFREFVHGSENMSDEEFKVFLQKFIACLPQFLHDGAIVDIFIDWRHIRPLLEIAETTFEFKQLCVWVKNNGGMGSFYRSQHELCCVFKHGSSPHINNFGLGETGRYRTNVWQYPAVRECENYRDEKDINHPTIKPVGLIADALRDCSHRNEIILEPFGGSGSAIVAAERTKRQARVIELDPVFCDMMIKRWEDLVEKKAELVFTGQSFADVRAQRFSSLLLPNHTKGGSDD